MEPVDLLKSCLESIRQISGQIADSILYLDAGCLEAFQFLGVFSLLLELGVCAVCSLENMSSLDIVVDWSSNYMDSAKKIVVITSRLLSDAHRYILRCLSTHQTVLHCTIFTSISEVAHSAYIDSPLGPDAYREYESLLLQDYEELVRKGDTNEHSSLQHGEYKHSTENNYQERLVSKDEGWSQLASSEKDISNPEASSTERDLGEDGQSRLVVSVHHFPMILCPLSPRVFVLPSEGTIGEAYLSNDNEDSLSPGLPPIYTGFPADGEDTPPGATLTAHFLYHLVAKMDLKMEIFSLGGLSKTIGKILTDMSSLYDVGRRNKRSAGLLLVDRTVDLVTPCRHGDSLFDRMLSSLPRRERTPSSSHAKVSHIQNKQAVSKLERAPLDVRIPLAKIYVKDDPASVNCFGVSECIISFLSGWNSSNSCSQITDSSAHNNFLYGKNSMQCELGFLSGSFVSTENYQGAYLLETILDRKTKDGVLLIKKWLQEALCREKEISKMRTHPGLATLPELHAMVNALASNQMSLIRNRGIIQLAIATEIALSEPHSSHWDAFISAERILSLSAEDSSQSLSAQIRDLINKSILVRPHDDHKKNMESSHALLSFRDAILVAIIGYILAGGNFATSGSGGPFSWEEERLLKEAIVNAILDNPTAAKFRFLNGLEEDLQTNLEEKVKCEKPKEADPIDQSAIEDLDDQWGSWDDEETEHNNEQVYGDMQLRLELRDRVDSLFKFFHKLSTLKRRNPSYREGQLGLESNFGSDIYANKGLLHKVLTLVLGKYDIPGLEYHSSTVGRLFKSGFGRFGLGQAKRSLGDQSIILVFVVGGINGLEVREAWEALLESGRPDVELIIGGTTLLTPDDMIDLLLGSSSYM